MREREKERERERERERDLECHGDMYMERAVYFLL